MDCGYHDSVILFYFIDTPDAYGCQNFFDDVTNLLVGEQ